MVRLSNEERKKPVKLDSKDIKILSLLTENARMPIAEIAKKIHIARDTTNYKMKRLEKEGVIVRYYPEINFEKLGYTLYRLFLLINETEKEKQAEVIEAIKNHPNTISGMEYSDRWDIEWVIIAKDIHEFDSIVTEMCVQFADIIMERRKLMVIKSYDSVLLPYEMDNDLRFAKVVKQESERPQYDKKDLEILQVLAENCRLSTYEIAKRVALSPDAIGLRIKKLVKENIIKKFTILPNFSLLGCSWYTLVIEMKTFEKKEEMKFKEFVRNHLYITSAEKTLGPWDVIVYIIADNPKNFHKTIKQIKAEFPAMVRSYDTFIAYREHVFYPFPKIVTNKTVISAKNTHQNI